MTHITRRTALTLIGATALSAPFIRRARAEGTLNVYNWSDYIGETTIADFEKETGITVTYDNYSSAEEMQAKMLAGSTGYDVVVQAGLNLKKFIAANIYQEIDHSKLTGWSNLSPDILKIMEGWDPGNKHGTPYMWGSVGFTYNLDLVKERLPNADLDSLDTIFKPENAAKLADCGISILDSPSDILLMVLKYMGKDPNVATEADMKAAADLFKPIRQDIRTFDNSNYLNAIPNGELCAVNNWSGDYSTASNRAKEAGININLAYHVPKTGSPIWVDTLCIPVGAANTENGYKFIDFLLRPEVIAKCTDLTNYANANIKANALIKPEILANPAVYPDAETTRRLYAPVITQEQEDWMLRVWTDVKSG